MSTSTHGVFAAGAVVAALALGGCAAPADRQAMTAGKGVVVATQHPYSVTVAATGGTETGALDSSNIANADLKAAIESSIKETRVFKYVLQVQGGQYELVVSVISLSKPSIGFSFTVDLECGWTLTRVSDRQVVLRKAFSSTYTASATAAFAGAVRLRLAVEGAAKANIEQGMKEIGSLSL